MPKIKFRKQTTPKKYGAHQRGAFAVGLPDESFRLPQRPTARESTPEIGDLAENLYRTAREKLERNGVTVTDEMDRDLMNLANRRASDKLNQNRGTMTQDNTKPLKVLSLSDGTSGWQSILRADGKKPGTDYEAYVSEIDPFATKFVDMNYPWSVKLGDLRNVHGQGYDAVIGGTPCVNLSSLGRREGFKDLTTGEILDTSDKYFAAKEQGHDITPSSLVYEFKRILDEARESGGNPKFMLENVQSMGDKFRDQISELMGVEPIRSRSRGIQPRKRYFWTNIMDQSEYDRAVMSKPKTLVKDLLDFDAPRRLDPKQRIVVSRYPFNAPTLVTGGKFEKSPYLVAGKGDEIPTLNTTGAVRVYKDGKSWYPNPDDYVRLHLEGIGDPSEIKTDGLSSKQLGRMLGNGWSHVDVSPLILGLFK